MHCHRKDHGAAVFVGIEEGPITFFVSQFVIKGADRGDNE